MTWLTMVLRGEWHEDPEAIRFEVAALTGEDNFAELVPNLTRSVWRDIELAQKLGIRSAPVVMVNGKEIDSADRDWVLCAIEVERAGRRGVDAQSAAVPRNTGGGS
jgi:protein-disulfide isomerase